MGFGDLFEPRLLLTMPVALFRYIAAIYIKSGNYVRVPIFLWCFGLAVSLSSSNVTIHNLKAGWVRRILPLISGRFRCQFDSESNPEPEPNPHT